MSSSFAPFAKAFGAAVPEADAGHQHLESAVVFSALVLCTTPVARVIGHIGIGR